MKGCLERRLQRDIGVILFGGTETVKEQDGRFWPGAVYHRQIELYTIDVQWDFLVGSTKAVIYIGVSKNVLYAFLLNFLSCLAARMGSAIGGWFALQLVWTSRFLVVAQQ